MGLDTTHGCWNGPYSSFGRFLKALGQQIGIDLDEYIGYGDKGTKDLTTIDHDLRPLFDHSDCDGELTVEESKQIVRGFDDVIENFDVEKEGYYNGLMDSIIQFKNGLSKAISKREIVYFQ